MLLLQKLVTNASTLRDDVGNSHTSSQWGNTFTSDFHVWILVGLSLPGSQSSDLIISRFRM